MPRDHTVKVGDQWMDGMLVGRAAAIAEWSIRKEIDDPAFRLLCRRLSWRKYAKARLARMTTEEKARIAEYKRVWRARNRDRCNARDAATKRQARARGAKWYKNERRRRKRNEETERKERRKQVYTCVVCGAQWCIGLGRIPTTPPKYCSQPCRARANYERGKARGAPWAQRGKDSKRAGECVQCGQPASRKGRKCSDCAAGAKAG